jgi:hypothetical protein
VITLKKFLSSMLASAFLLTGTAMAAPSTHHKHAKAVKAHHTVKKTADVVTSASPAASPAAKKMTKPVVKKPMMKKKAAPKASASPAASASPK